MATVFPEKADVASSHVVTVEPSHTAPPSPTRPGSEDNDGDGDGARSRHAASPSPDSPPGLRARLGSLARRAKRKATTRQGWLGDYDFLLLCTPQLPRYSWDRAAGRSGIAWLGRRTARKQRPSGPPFYALDESMPILLGAIVGLQHALAMLAGLIAPPIILSSSLAFDPFMQQYLVSASLISSGILSALQMSRIPLPGGYQLGTGLITVVGTSFATLSTATSIFGNMYKDGTCPTVTLPDGSTTRGPCPEAYGYLLGTAALCSLVELALSFLPVRTLRRMFPPMVTGSVVLLIGASLIQSSGFPSWAGGSGSCMNRPANGTFSVCPQVGAPNALPWGSPEYLGLGLLSFLTIVLVELFGSPFLKNASVVVGLIVGMIVAGPTGYVDGSNITSAKAITFLWTTTFPLKVYGPAVLPLMAVYLSLMMEAIGDITASSEASRVEVDGPIFDARIQGGVMADGLNGLLASLFTITPMSIFAQNNGVIALSRCANRQAGYWCCAWLILFGVLGKISGVFLSIPSSVLGGVTTFLFASVCASGLRVLSLVEWTRRSRFILAGSLGLGFGNLLVSTWATYLFAGYTGDNAALRSFMNSLVIIIETPFLICALAGILLNVILPEEEAEEMAERCRGG